MRFFFLFISMNSLVLYDFLESISSFGDWILEDFLGFTDLLRFLFNSIEDDDVLRRRCLCRVVELVSCWDACIGGFIYSGSDV